MARTVGRTPWLELVSLIDERAVVLHSPEMAPADTGLSGSDVDCALSVFHPMWPLRLRNGWRLCQSLHYDLRGWHWVLERDGNVVALDTIHDPLGLGRDGISTDLLVAREQGEASPAMRAAYLTIKRTRKRVEDPQEWERIGRLAATDPAGFLDALQAIGGLRLAELLSGPAIRGCPPDPELFPEARRQLRRRRFGSPGRVVVALALGTRRYIGRVRHPSGMKLLLCGPDGAGKSTLAAELPAALDGVFKRYGRYHWRPGLLPRPGSLVGREAPDPTKPHGRQPFGAVVSFMLLGYYWADFLLGRWPSQWILRIRTGLLVQERGWWDIAVDPLRFRLKVPPRLVRALGQTLKGPDLALVLEGDPETLAARKNELPIQEISRQVEAWRQTLPRQIRAVRLDATRSPDGLVQEAYNEVLGYLEERAVSRLGSGWACLPSGRNPRWWIPRGPRSVAASALNVYQPTRTRAIIGWTGARLAARTGALRSLPRGRPPPLVIREALAPHLPGRSTVAVARANHYGRYVALVMTLQGEGQFVAKIATDEEGRRALSREGAAILSLAPALPPPLSAPRVLASEPGILLLEAVDWELRSRPWELDEEVAASLGIFFDSGKQERAGSVVGPAHGDCAPWNLFRTRRGWVLLDWEAASLEAPPFHDVAHYLVQAHSLLGRPSSDELLTGVRRGGGWIGAALGAYADGARLNVRDVEECLRSYLIRTHADLRPKTPAERLGVVARRRLLEQMER